MLLHVITCHMSNDYVDHWDMLIAEQLLFSCLGSKGTIFQAKMSMIFLGPPPPHPVSLDVIELVPS